MNLQETCASLNEEARNSKSSSFPRGLRVVDQLFVDGDSIKCKCGTFFSKSKDELSGHVNDCPGVPDCEIKLLHAHLKNNGATYGFEAIRSELDDARGGYQITRYQCGLCHKIEGCISAAHAHEHTDSDFGSDEDTGLEQVWPGSHFAFTPNESKATTHFNFRVAKDNVQQLATAPGDEDAVVQIFQQQQQQQQQQSGTAPKVLRNKEAKKEAVVAAGKKKKSK